MPNQIERDAFVKRDVLKNPIPYTRGTDLLPIVIHFRDFQIPSGATARVFVAKADGNAVYTTATIDGNDVTVDVTDQMFIELGTALMQISIMDGEEELVSFVQPVDVKQNLKAGDLPASTTDVKFLDEAIEQANEAVNTATTAAQQAATAVQNANQAIEDANEAISDLNAQIASLNTNFASLANNVNIPQLDTTAKTLVGAIDELNSKTFFAIYEESSAGWKRIAKYGDSNLTMAQGAGGNNALIFLRTAFEYAANMTAIIIFESSYNASSFKVLSKKGSTVISKIRYVIDAENMGYIEVYYNSDTANRITVSMPCNMDGTGSHRWQPTEGESTEEVVEGVIVKSSLDLTV